VSRVRVGLEVLSDGRPEIDSAIIQASSTGGDQVTLQDLFEGAGPAMCGIHLSSDVNKQPG
jgi:hypothetical protein